MCQKFKIHNVIYREKIFLIDKKKIILIDKGLIINRSTGSEIKCLLTAGVSWFAYKVYEGKQGSLKNKDGYKFWLREDLPSTIRIRNGKYVLK